MLTPVRTVAPAATPVSLVEAKAYCRVDDADSDTVITALIAAATDHLDGWPGILGRALVTQTWRQDFASFTGCLRLPLAPVASITAVAYFDSEGAQQTLDESVYSLFADARGPYVGLKIDQTWPSASTRQDAVSVTFVAGVAAADVPPALKAAILRLVSHWNENREAVVTGTITATVPLGFNEMIAPYRRVGV